MVGSGSKGPADRVGESDARKRRLALAQLPARMRRAIRLFRQLTGLTAVTSLRTAMDDGDETTAISPPVHPRCASQLGKAKSDAPCEEQWQLHLQTGRRTHRAQTHICPLGLRCSCVPISYGESLVGIAKVVAGPATTDRRFSLAAQALELAVSKVCHDLHVYALSEELEALRKQVAEFRDVGRGARAAPQVDEPVSKAREGSLIDQTLGYLGEHYVDSALSLAEVSRALGVNSKYLTRLFTRVVGQHMHPYIVDLRVERTCRLLLSTDRPVKAIALDSGFRRPEGFSRVFQEHVGVAPSVYRRIFTAP